MFKEENKSDEVLHKWVSLDPLRRELWAKRWQVRDLLGDKPV